MSEQPSADQPTPPVTAAEQLHQQISAKLARLDKLRRIRKGLGRVVAVLVLGVLIYNNQRELRVRVPVIASYLNSRFLALIDGKSSSDDKGRNGAIQGALASAKEQNAYLDSIMDNTPDNQTGKPHSKSPGSNSTVTANGGLKKAMDSARINAAMVNGAMDNTPAPHSK